MPFTRKVVVLLLPPYPLSFSLCGSERMVVEGRLESAGLFPSFGDPIGVLTVGGRKSFVGYLARGALVV